MRFGRCTVAVVDPTLTVAESSDDSVRLFPIVGAAGPAVPDLGRTGGGGSGGSGSSSSSSCISSDFSCCSSCGLCDPAPRSPAAKVDAEGTVVGSAAAFHLPHDFTVFKMDLWGEAP